MVSAISAGKLVAQSIDKYLKGETLTRESAEISGISYVMDADKEEAEKILNS